MNVTAYIFRYVNFKDKKTLMNRGGTRNILGVGVYLHLCICNSFCTWNFAALVKEAERKVAGYTQICHVFHPELHMTENAR